MAATTSSTVMPRAARASGSAFTRTADLVPYTMTRLTPLMMLICWPICVLAMSYNWPVVRLSLVSPMYMTGWSFGLLLLNVGGLGRSVGRLPVAWVMAVCTSVAAASMLLDRLNWSVRMQLPWVLVDVTSSNPGICMNCRSSGVAMLFAIVCGLAPG